MKIGVISDTHGCYAVWQQVVDNFFSDADYIIHAGDVLYHGPRNNIPAEYNPKMLIAALNECQIPLLIVCGNCDSEVDSMVLSWPVQSPFVQIVQDGLRIIVNHGYKLSHEAIAALAKQMKADIFITGHTHEACLKTEENTIFLNPGSPCMSKRLDGRGTAAIIQDNLIKVFDVNSGEILFALDIKN